MMQKKRERGEKEIIQVQMMGSRVEGRESLRLPGCQGAREGESVESGRRMRRAREEK